MELTSQIISKLGAKAVAGYTDIDNDGEDEYLVYSVWLLDDEGDEIDDKNFVWHCDSYKTAKDLIFEIAEKFNLEPVLEDMEKN